MLPATWALCDSRGRNWGRRPVSDLPGRTAGGRARGSPGCLWEGPLSLPGDATLSPPHPLTSPAGPPTPFGRPPALWGPLPSRPSLPTCSARKQDSETLRLRRVVERGRRLFASDANPFTFGRVNTDRSSGRHRPVPFSSPLPPVALCEHTRPPGPDSPRPVRGGACQKRWSDRPHVLCLDSRRCYHCAGRFPGGSRRGGSIVWVPPAWEPGTASPIPLVGENFGRGSWFGTRRAGLPWLRAWRVNRHKQGFAHLPCAAGAA